MYIIQISRKKKRERERDRSISDHFSKISKKKTPKKLKMNLVIKFNAFLWLSYHLNRSCIATTCQRVMSTVRSNRFSKKKHKKKLKMNLKFIAFVLVSHSTLYRHLLYVNPTVRSNRFSKKKNTKKKLKMNLKFIAFVLVTIDLVSSSTLRKETDQVTSLPGWNQELPYVAIHFSFFLCVTRENRRNARESLTFFFHFQNHSSHFCLSRVTKPNKHQHFTR